jgi:hypothetical protein
MREKPTSVCWDQIEREYGNVSMRFMYYFSYTFWFSGTTENGGRVTATYGGDPDDLYNYEVSGGDCSLNELHIREVTVEKVDGTVLRCSRRW